MSQQVDVIIASHEGYQIRHGSTTIVTKHVVIAGGAASMELIPGLQMSEVKGQCFQLDAQKLHLAYTLFHQGCYLIPRPDGTMAFCSHRQLPA